VLLLEKRKQMDSKKLGKKIKLGRIELDLTQTQLAEKTNGKQKSISGYETRATLPSIRTLIKITKILKKPASHFLDE
jgi:transcriptional regulator with XRE-family HTH domain